MLVLTRRANESLVIRDDIIVTILAIEGDKVKIGIQAPAEVTILRQELCEAVRAQNLAAAQATPASLAAVQQVLGEAPASASPAPPEK